MSRKKLKFLIVGIIIVSTVGYLVYGATKNAGLYYLTISELMEREEMMDRALKVKGQVVDDSIKWYWKKLPSVHPLVENSTSRTGDRTKDGVNPLYASGYAYQLGSYYPSLYLST